MNESEINKDAKGKGERGRGGGGGGTKNTREKGREKREDWGGEKGRECLQPRYCFLHLYVRRRT